MPRARLPVLAITVQTISETLLAVEALITLACARVLLRLVPGRVLRAACVERGGGRDADPRVIDVFARVAARAPIGHTCLHRSLALQRILARRGTHARLRIGVGAKPRRLPGHAWLEVGGRIINDAPEFTGRYTALETR